MAATAPCALAPDKFLQLQLRETQDVSANTKVFRFDLPDAKQSLNLPVASCILVRANCGANGAEVIRPYTPISDSDVKGHFDLMIKTYAQGNMSRHIWTLKPGDTLDVKGPFNKLQYPYKQKRLGMIVGGTGITPMLQVLNEVFKHPADPIQVSLVYANIAPADILLKNRIDALAAKHAAQFNVFYVVEKPTDEWKQGVGFVTADIVKQHTPPPSDENIVFVCGPPGMMKALSGEKNPDKSQGALSGLLKELGYTEAQVYKF